MYSDRLIGINLGHQPRFEQPCDCASLCCACREFGMHLCGHVPRVDFDFLPSLRTSEEYFVEQLVGHGRIFVLEEEGFLVVLA